MNNFLKRCEKFVENEGEQFQQLIRKFVAVVVAFFICWAPFHVQRLFAIYGTKQKTPVMLKIYEIVTYISGILYYVSTTINPILYHTMSLKFREAFKDTLTRCCGFRGIKGHRARRSYSILSRSAQRGTMGASNAGQESTDYSGNSVREEVLPGGQGSGGSCGSSVKEASGTSRSFRRQESGYVSGGRNHDPKSPTINWVTSPSNGINHNNIDGQNYKRSFSVIISASQCNESDLKTTMVHSLNGQNKQISQNPITSESISDSKRKEKRNAERTKKNAFWSIFKNITGPANTVEESRKLSVSYSPTPATPNQSSQFTMSSEVFDMMPVCRSNSIRSLASSSNNVSNSSLRDVERGALEDELTAYMQELRRREEC